MKVGASGRPVPGLGIAALALTSGLLVSACSGSPASPARRAAAGRSAVLPAGATLLATPDGTVARYARPGGVRTGRVPGTWYGARLTLPVLATRPGWLRVGLPRRPNGSTAWLPDTEVRLGMTPYRILINLATTHLTLYKDGRQVFSTPAGVGTRSDPTPAGDYFVAFLERPPPASPGYGAFIMVTSDHSDSIRNWEGSGDAAIGIHGPLGDDREIGTAGARISHGCIRLHEADLRRLRDVPAGTPVDIIR